MLYLGLGAKTTWLGLGQCHGRRNQKWRLPVENCPFLTPLRMLKMSADLHKNNTHFDCTERIGNIPGHLRISTGVTWTAFGRMAAKLDVISAQQSLQPPDVKVG